MAVIEATYWKDLTLLAYIYFSDRQQENISFPLLHILWQIYSALPWHVFASITE